MPKILVVGPTPAVQRRVTLGVLQRNQVNRAAHVEVLPSGKGLNCARAAARLGADVEALLFLGGEPGAWVLHAAKEEGIRVRAVDAPSPTRTCCTLIETQEGCVTELVENAGPVDSASEDAFVRAYQECVQDAAAVVFAGTLPAGAQPTMYRKLAEMADFRPTILDTQGQALLAALPARPTLAKPNRHEIAAATACSTETREGLCQAVARLHELGARNVLVTDGPRPALFSNGEYATEVCPRQIEVSNPIGSGDALAAGIAVALVRGAPLPEAIQFGIACGAANAEGQGYGRIELSRIP